MRDEKGRFTKGNTSGGRKAGSQNKVTQEIRDAFAEIVNGNLDRLMLDIKHMQGKDRVNYIIQIAKFVVPTLRATELDVNHDIPMLTNDGEILDLTDSESIDKFLGDE